MSFDSSPNPEQRIQEVWRAYTTHFARQLYEKLSEEEKMEVDRTAGDDTFIEDAITFALTRPERFKSELVELVKNLATVSGGQGLVDTVHNGGLAVDLLGNLVVIRSQEMELEMNEDKSELGDSTYEVLTGPDVGKEYSTRSHPLWSPRTATKVIIEE